MRGLVDEVRYAVRVLSGKPGFFCAAVLILALGIAASTATFSVVNAVLLSPLPYREPDRVVVVWEKRQKEGTRQNAVSPADYLDWREQNHMFCALDASDQGSVNLTGAGRARRVVWTSATADLTGVYGIQPVVGRAFNRADENGNGHIVLLSYGLWRQQFGGDPKILHRIIHLNEEPYEVIGVLPARFRIYFGEDADVYVPQIFTPKDRLNRMGHALLVTGRLRNEVALSEAQAEMETISRSLESRYPEANTGHSANLIPLPLQLRERIRPVLLILMSAVSFVLLIACANVANLLLARSALRKREMATRRALGAQNRQILRLLFAESSLIAGVAAGLGIGLARLGLRLVPLLPQTLGASNLPGLEHIGLDYRVLMFALGLSALTALVFSILPALQFSGARLQEGLQMSGRWSSGGVASRRLRSALVVSEMGVACALLIGAGLLIDSLGRLLRQDPGFSVQNRLTMELSLPQRRYRDLKSQNAFYDRLLRRVSALPAVDSTGLTTLIPGNTWGPRFGLVIENRPRPRTSEEWPKISWRVVSDGYLATMNIPVLRGRGFTPSDTMDAPKAALISQAAARRFYGGQDPVGTRIALGHDPTWRTVVGIVGSTRYLGLDKEPEPELYLPTTQFMFPGLQIGLVVHALGDVSRLRRPIEREIAAIDPELPESRIRTVEELLAESTASQRFSTVLLGAFAVIAFLLAATGLYSVLAYSVTQRRKEIGIRVAIGARRADIFRLIMAEGTEKAVTGIACGGLAAFVLSGALKALLFGVSPAEPWIYAAAAGLLFAVALIAGLIPALRAMRVDPIQTLRQN